MENKKGVALVSMCMGLVALILNFMVNPGNLIAGLACIALGIGALVMGIIGVRTPGENRPMAITGIVTGGFLTLLSFLGFLAGFFQAVLSN